jgi:hypothetical protein
MDDEFVVTAITSTLSFLSSFHLTSLITTRANQSNPTLTLIIEHAVRYVEIGLIMGGERVREAASEMHAVFSYYIGDG